MNFDPQHFVGSLIPIAFVLFILYRRFRRNFGRQKLRPGYLKFRMTVLCVVGVLLLIPTFFSTELALVTILGLAVGVGLAVWAAKHTRFLREDGVLYYIPHTYTGMVVTALFIGRLVYRFVMLSSSGYSFMSMDGQNMGPGDFGGMSAIYHNPVTRAVFFILIGYYVYYYWYVLHESKHLKDSDMEDGIAVSPKSKSEPGGNVV